MSDPCGWDAVNAWVAAGTELSPDQQTFIREAIAEMPTEPPGGLAPPD
jgi:hypothetical protein